MTLTELRAAYQAGEISEPIMMDNDEVYVYTDDGKAFSMDPGELLDELLDLVGIPHEKV